MSRVKSELLPVWTALGAGALFGVGLVVAGMTRPAKVISFLDFGGTWDPSLAFVMAGAILVHMVLYRVVLRRRSPVYDVEFHLPTRKDIDVRLVAGAALFGAGWGLGGYCPGPALVSAGSGALPALVLVAAMAAGMWLQAQLLPARESGARDKSRDVPVPPPVGADRPATDG